MACIGLGTTHSCRYGRDVSYALQEPPPPKAPKPLPRPDDPYSKKRAGKRVRKQKVGRCSHRQIIMWPLSTRNGARTAR